MGPLRPPRSPDPPEPKLKATTDRSPKDRSIRPENVALESVPTTRNVSWTPAGDPCATDPGESAAARASQPAGRIPGDHTGGATPVPIPNTAVKPVGPMIVQPRESRSSPGSFHPPQAAPARPQSQPGRLFLRPRHAGVAIRTSSCDRASGRLREPRPRRARRRAGLSPVPSTGPACCGQRR